MTTNKVNALELVPGVHPFRVDRPPAPVPASGGRVSGPRHRSLAQFPGSSCRKPGVYAQPRAASASSPVFDRLHARSPDRQHTSYRERRLLDDSLGLFLPFQPSQLLSINGTGSTAARSDAGDNANLPETCSQLSFLEMVRDRWRNGRSRKTAITRMAAAMA